MAELKLLIEELHKIEGENKELSIEYRAAHKSEQGKLMDKILDNIGEAKQLVKQLEMTDRSSPATKQWKDKLKDMSNAADTLKGHYVTGGEDDGIFDNEANMVVRNQNDKLRGALKMSDEAQGYGARTKEELHRINEKLKGVRSKVGGF